MTYDACWPKKRGRPPKPGTVHFRMYLSHQEKLLQAQKEEPLTDFDMAAKIEGLRRRR